MSINKIVGTKIGVISNIGIGYENFNNNLFAKPSSPIDIDLFDLSSIGGKKAFQIVNFDPSAILGKKGLRTLDRATKLLLATIQLDMSSE